MLMLKHFLGKDVCADGVSLGTVSSLSLYAHYGYFDLTLVVEGRMTPIYEMVDKTATIDGCYVGKITEATNSVRTYGADIFLTIAVPNECWENIREYLYYAEIMEA